MFASCTTTDPIGPGVNKKIEVTTLTKTKTALTEPRFDCNGLRLKHDKVVEWLDETLKRDTIVSCGCTDSEIKAKGYTYGTQWWNKAPWEWLLWILGLGLLLWLLWLLFNQVPARRIAEQPPVVQQVNVPFVPEGYDLVKKGYVQLPEGSGYAPAGMSIVSKDQVVIPANGNYIAPRNEKEALVITVTPMSETHITNTFSIPSNEGWPKREETKKEENKTTEDTPQTE